MSGIQVYDDLVSRIALEQLSDFSKDCSYNYGWKSDSELDASHWHYGFVDVQDDQDLIGKNVNLANEPGFLAFPFLSQIWEDLQIRLGSRNLLRCYLNLHTRDTEGFVHVDEDKRNEIPGMIQETLVFYLNQEWNQNWAGETVVFQNGEIISSVLPKFGRTTKFLGRLPHCARGISKLCPVPRRIMAMKTSVANISEPMCLAWLRENTSSIKHSGGTLFEHLSATGLSLRGMGAAQSVYIAGAFHSIFGTSSFDIPKAFSEQDVRALIGDRSYNLVKLFASIPAPRIEHILTKIYSKADQFDLACMEYANLLEQAPRTKDPEKQMEQLAPLIKFIKEKNPLMLRS